MYWTLRKRSRELKVTSRIKVILLKLIGWKVMFHFTKEGVE